MMNTTTLQGPYVFISYPRSEEVFVKRLVQDLRAHGFQVWRDETNIAPGSPDWEAAIRVAIRNAYAIVLIASPEVTKSLYIKGELNLAKRYHPNRIYPIWIGGTEWSDCVPIDFINAQYVDIRGERYATGLNILVNVLRKAVEQSSLNMATPQAPMPGSSPTPVLDRLAPTYSAGPGGQLSVPNTGVDSIPPPLPPDSYISAPSPQSAPTLTPAPGTYVVPDYAKALRRSRGCLIRVSVTIMLLLVLALSGVGAYFIGRGNPSTQGGNAPTSGGTSTANGSTTEQLNLKFTYSSIDFTVTSVEYAPSFSDDASVSSGGVRVAFMESNPTSDPAFFAYGVVARLILPDGSTIAPGNEQNAGPPAPQASRTNWIDFPVASPTSDLSKLVLQMGTPEENRMMILLSHNANLSQYQPQTTSLNIPFLYAGVNWTLTKATISFSANAQQATAGHIYVVVTLNVVNNSQNGVINAPTSYIRLRSGSTTSSPTNYTIPAPIASQSTGSGTATFLMPQGNTSYTLLMLANQTLPPGNQVTVNFQVQ